MQVSWIDPNEVRSLLMQITGPVTSPGPTAWETHTYPLGEAQPQATDLAARLPLQAAPAFPPTPLTPPAPAPQPVAPPPAAEATVQAAPTPQALTITPAPSVEPVQKAASVDQIKPIQEATQSANAELERIRQRLRELRERAQQSGVISAPGATLPAPAVGLPPLTQPMAELAPQPDSAPLHYGGTAADNANLVQPSIEQPFSIAPIQLASAAPPASTTLESATTVPPQPPPQSPQSPLPPQPQADADNPRVDRPTFQAPDRGLTERLGALAQWACQRLQTQEIVLVDDFGDVLWGSPGHTALVLSGMMAWHSAQRSNALQHMDTLDRRIDKEMQGGQQLTIVPVRTRYGIVSLAAIRPTRMDDAEVDAIHQALVVAVEGGS
jgi:hypothetical protein